MSASTPYPSSVSLYEAVRTRPSASAPLARLGLTRDYYDLRLGEAARAAGVPVSRLTKIIEEADPGEG